MKVRNKRPYAVEIAPGDYPVIEVEAAGEADAPDRIAGRPPLVDNKGAVVLDEAGNPVDLGEGLLAQTDNWEQVLEAAPKTKKGGD